MSTPRLDVPSVGWRLPELWRAIGPVDPVGVGVLSGGPFLLELAGGADAIDIDSPTISGGGVAQLRKNWEQTRALVIRKRRPVEDGRIHVGRAASNDVVIANALVSKSHAWFIERDGRFGLADDSSRNGTSIDGEALVPGTVYAVTDGAEIGFGEAQFLFLMPDSLHQALRGMFPAETSA